MTIEQLLKKIFDTEPKNPTPMLLLEIIRKQSEEIELLKDEIARLKGNKPRPQIKPSSLEKPLRPESPKEERPARKKRKSQRQKIWRFQKNRF